MDAYALQDSWLTLMEFMARGGQVLWFIAGVAVVLWTLAIERAIYYWFNAGRTAKQVGETWDHRQDKSSWHAHQIREKLLSEHQLRIDFGLAFLATLVALCPLLGLLGTVTGMIEVFANLGNTGTNNAKNMAAGVSKATIPTMAGMVIALSGLFIKTILTAKADRLKTALQSRLDIHN